MTNNFKKVIDRPMWVHVAPAPNTHAAGVSLACDLRKPPCRYPFVFELVSNTVLNRYNIVQKAWNFVVSPALGGTFGAGAGAVYAPSLSLLGAIGAGCSTTTIITTTTLTAVGVNMLANRGGSGEYGFRIRIIGNSAGSSGKIEERWIVANSASTTPAMILDTPLSFTPANGDKYEILGGRLFALGAGALAAASFRAFEVATNSLTSLTNTNLPATIGTDFSAIALDELYVPYDCYPSEGLLPGSLTYNSGLRCHGAVTTSANTLTGSTTGGDLNVLANEYRNFQIRIVEDTVNPTAANQRRIISTHTAGPSPVYTIGTNWAVTPSATAKYVIENPNLILLRSTASTTMHVYNYTDMNIYNGSTTIAYNSWHNTYFGTAPGAMGAGCIQFPSYGIRPDAAKFSRHSYVYNFRGAGTATLDVLNISGGASGTWDANVVYDGGVTINTGSCGKYAPHDQEGRFGYLNSYVASQVNQIYRFDVRNRVMSPVTPTDWIQAGTAAVGDRIATFGAFDGTDYYTVCLLLMHTAAIAQELIVLI